MACELKHTAGKHGHAFMFFGGFFVNEEHQTLDRFYSTPFLYVEHQVHNSNV